MRYCRQIETYERCEAALLSTQGYRLPVNPLKSELIRELLRLGSVSPRSMRRDVMVPFSTETLQILTGEIELKPDTIFEQNYEKILNEIAGFAMQYPEIGKIKNKICEILVKECQDSSCVTLHRKMIEYGCANLATKPFEYLKYHLVRMVSQRTIDVQFYRIDFDDFSKILDDDELNVENELDLLQVIEAWISACPMQRERFRVPLRTHLRKAGIPPTELLTIPNVENLSTKPARKICDVMITIGGWLHKQATDNVEWFDVENRQWERSKIVLPMKIAYHGAAIIDQDLYIFGGSDGMRFKCETWKFSGQTGEWKRCDQMMDPRNYITNSCVVYDGKIYVFGGQCGRMINNRNHRCDTAEVYDPKIDKWTYIARMHDMRSDAAATLFGDQIYIAGGFNGTRILNTVEVYNPKGDFYLRVAPLPTPLSGHSLLAHQNDLLLVGGFNAAERQNKILVWSDRDGWVEHDEKLRFGRSTCSACSYRGHVVMAGGYTNAVERSCETLLGPQERVYVPDMLQNKSATKLLVGKNWRKILDKFGTIPKDRLPPTPIASYARDEDDDDFHTIQ
ncbi:unnamed protein product [Caenorhabditis bovis]|uniref:BACK domain-containing protein n=1 Tax=Caenorhabditis bovis TaxID=2654633 RepID=A0A8S1F0N2_9PELO|nr:unnamed protein product [Caenorhabditis bovis]